MKLRKIAAVAAASALSLSMAINASAAEYDAFLMFTDFDWLWGNWNAGKAGDAKVNGYGTYTVSLDSTQAENAMSATNGAQVFCVDIVGGGAEFSVDNTVVTIDSIKTDGTEIKVDNSKIAYGDIEENGNFRIEIRNAYGVTGDAMNEHYEPIDSENFSAAEKIEVTFTLASAGGDAAPAETEAEAAPVETEAAPAEAENEPVLISETAPAEPAETEAPAPTISETPAAATGNLSVAAIAGVMAAAGAAAFALRKRK